MAIQRALSSHIHVYFFCFFIAIFKYIGFGTAAQPSWTQLPNCDKQSNNLKSPEPSCTHIRTPDDGIYYSIKTFEETKSSFGIAITIDSNNVKYSKLVLGIIGAKDDAYLVVLSNGHNNLKSVVQYKYQNESNGQYVGKTILEVDRSTLFNYNNVYLASSSSISKGVHNTMKNKRNYNLWLSYKKSIFQIGIGHIIGKKKYYTHVLSSP